MSIECVKATFDAGLEEALVPLRQGADLVLAVNPGLNVIK